MHYLRSLLAATACVLVCLQPVTALTTSTPLVSELLVKAQAFIPGLYTVSPSLVRGAQPKPGGLRLLKQAGVKTVINLTENNFEETEAKEVGLNYINIPTSHFKPLPKETIDRFLAAVSNAEMSPVFLHCKEGEDRTGALVAIYRIDHEKWSVAKSYKEMVTHGFHPFFTQLTKSVYAYAAKGGTPEPIPSPLLGSLTNPFKRYTGSPVLPTADKPIAVDPEQL